LYTLHSNPSMSEHNLYVQNSLAMERLGSCSRNQQTFKKLLYVGTQKPFKGHKLTCRHTVGNPCSMCTLYF
jgi:hypothetical protein